MGDGCIFVRITKKIFHDLAIYMVGLGVLVGVVFPFFIMLLGTPGAIALKPLFFVACVAAGILLAVMNILLARSVVGTRIRELSGQMKHIEGILAQRKGSADYRECTAETCCITVDSEDELGESAESFNRLILTLSDVLEAQTDVRRFSEMLTSHLELETLASETLCHLMQTTQASGGVILTEQGGELNVVAFHAIDLDKSPAVSSLFRLTLQKKERQIIRLPEDLMLDGVLAHYRPREILLEPILYKQVVIGILILATVETFSEACLERITVYGPMLSMAFNNAITYQQMQQLAALDALTGIYNRRFGFSRLQEEYSRASRSGSSLSLIVIDIDHFKTVNDTYGHMIGDKIIVLITKTMKAALREGDVMIRYGGEEFLCVLPGANQQDASFVAERIRVLVMDSVLRDADREIKVTISLGCVTYPQHDCNDIYQLINLADEAMYTAKKQGRNRVIAV